MAKAKKKIVKITKKVTKKETVEAVPAILIKEELSDLEKFFVKSKFEAGETILKINETLKKDEQLIKDYIDSFKRKGPTQFEQTVCRKTGTNKDGKGITIATQASSSIGDEATKQFKPGKMKYSDCITQIKEK